MIALSMCYRRTPCLNRTAILEEELEDLTRGFIPVPDYIAFDTETTGLSADEDQIIEVALVRFKDGVPVDKWTSLVRPDKQVGLKTLRLTGITLEELAESQPIAAICHKIEEFRGRLPLVGHNPEFDTSFLSKPIPGFPGVPVYDTLELARIVYPGFKTYKLSDLARELNIALDDAHRACDDAEASGILFRLIQEKIAVMPVSLRQKIVWVMGKEWLPGRVFQWDAQDSCHQPSLFEGVPSDGIVPVSVSADFERFWVHRVLAGEERFTTVNAYLDSATLARIVGSALKVACPEQPIVIAGDFQRLDPAPEGASYLSVSADYLCTLKAKMVEDLACNGFFDSLDMEDKRFLASVIVWMTTAREGLFSEIQIVGRGYELRRELCCSEFPSCQEYCPVQEQCYYLKALENAGQAKVILTTKDGCFGQQRQAEICIVLGAADLARVWEKRQPRLDLAKFNEALAGAGHAGCLKEAKRTLQKSLDALGRLNDALIPQAVKESLSRLYENISPAVVEMRQQVKDQTARVINYPVDPPVISAPLHRLEYWMEQMRQVLVEDGTSLGLLERGYSDGSFNNAVFSKKQLWPAIEARNTLLGRYKKVVLASQEISFARKFHGLRHLYGIEGDEVAYREEMPESFHSPKEGALLISVDAGRPVSGSGLVELTGSFLEALMAKVSQNAMCLCPSLGFIRSLNSTIAPVLESKGIAVFAQGVDGGARVVGHLSEPATLVLARFGVDISHAGGTGTEILVIPKIPFLPPNMIDDLRRRELSAMGKDGFVEINVLPVVLAIRSYIEDLCRVKGKAAVVLLDPKILPGQRGWGSNFAQNFSDVNKVVCPPQDAVTRIAAWAKRSSKA